MQKQYNLDYDDMQEAIRFWVEKVKGEEVEAVFIDGCMSPETSLFAEVLMLDKGELEGVSYEDIRPKGVRVCQKED